MWQLLAKSLLGVVADGVKGFVATKKMKGELKLTEIKAAKKLEEEKKAFESVLRVKIDGMKRAEMSDVGIRNWIFMEFNVLARIGVSVTLCISIYIVLIVAFYQSMKPISQFISILREMIPSILFGK